jgi:hypothetical protein
MRKPPNISLMVPAKVGRHLMQYKQMCVAIATCHYFDECKDIIDKSVAMAAYYAQIKDSETELMFYRVRLRAWRRIGELFATVDLKGCENPTQKGKRIREAFANDPTVREMKDYRIVDVVKLMAISDKDFEYAIKQNVNGSVTDLLRRTPAAEAASAQAQKERAAHNKRWEQQQREEAEKNKANVQAALKAARMQEKHEEELDRAAEAAMKEVGITLERKDRANMKQVVFLIKDEVHEAMRKAAFDKRITMQEVLRRGLKLWLEANGYEWPDDPAPYHDREDRPTA